MKKLIGLTLLLYLTACIQVKNMGCYGQNPSHDERLLGRWIAQTSSLKPRNFAIWPYLSGYILLPSQAKHRVDANDNSDLFWTIKLSDYDFILMEGLLYRYELVGRSLKVLELDTEGHFEEIRQIVDSTETIKLEKIRLEWAQLTYTTLKIEVMDAAATAALAELASRQGLWVQTQTAQRASD